MIQDVQTRIYYYFPELVKANDPRKKEITIEHLLTMTSGLQLGNFQVAKNWVKSILEQPIIQKPGEIFQYNSGVSHLLSAIIHKISGVPTAIFADENLFSPIGIKKYLWVKDLQGIHGGGFSMSMTIEDMLLNK